MALSTPDSEPRLFSGPGAGLRLVLLVTLAVVLMVLDHRNQHLVQIRNLMGEALYPLQQAVDAPFSATRWARSNLATREQLIAENENLQRTLLVQDGRLQRMAALEAENRRMRALLESTAKVGDQVIIAGIVSVDMDRLRHRVVLNRGSQDGAFLGQALIDANGIVGQVTRDRGTSSEALLITDLDHAVPVEIVRTGLRTIAVGTGDLERLSLPFMARNADVKVGDLLVSSGLGGTFPPGYPVGTITEVRGDTGEPFLSVAAKPAAALDRIHEVLLVRPSARPIAPEVEEPGAPPALGPMPAPGPSVAPAPSQVTPPTEAVGAAPVATPTPSPAAPSMTSAPAPGPAAATPPPAEPTPGRSEGPGTPAAAPPIPAANENDTAPAAPADATDERPPE